MVACQHHHSKVLFGMDGYSIIECADCGLRKSSPVPSPEQIENVYGKNFYSKEECARFSPVLEIIIRLFRVLRAFELSYFYHPERILDVGCGRGLMLYYLKKYFKATYVVGTQFSPAVINHARKKYGLELKRGRLQENAETIKGQLDCISFWHVLEHIDDVDGDIELSRVLLRNNGLLLVEVPNSESFSQRLLKASWMGWDIPNHLTHFTPTSLSNLLKRHNFKIIKKNYFSFEYSIFFSIQSFLNKISAKKNMLYNFFLINTKNKNFSMEILAHLILAIIVAPCVFFLNMSLYNSAKGECLHYVAQKL